MSIFDKFEEQSRENPNRPFLTYKDRSYTYSEVLHLSFRVAALFQKNGLKAGERVILYLDNSDVYVLSLLGAFAVGAIIVPLSPRQNIEHVLYVAKDCDPSLIIVDESVSTILTPVVHTRVISSQTISGNIAKPLPSGEPQRTPVYFPDALVIYTSGSSGEAKGIVCAHQQILFVCSAIAKSLEITEKDRILCGLPFSFDYGLYQLFIAIGTVAHVVISSAFQNVISIPKQINDQQITVLPLVPSLIQQLIYSRLLERVSFPQLRCLTATGEALNVKCVTKLASILPYTDIVPMYGLTECKRVSIVPRGMSKNKPGSCGVPLEGTEVWIQKEGTFEETHHVWGELLVSGPHLMNGYWNNSQASHCTYFETESPVNGKVRALRTGDVFWQDQDGYLFYLGRKERVHFTEKGPIFPEQIEVELETFDEILEALVSIEKCNNTAQLKIWVVPNSYHTFDFDGINEQCKSKFSDYLNVQDVILVMQIPKTINGKKDRKSDLEEYLF